MKKSYREEILKGVYDDSLFKNMTKDMPEEEKKYIEHELLKFVDQFAGPLLEQFQALADSPEAVEELKKQLGKQAQGVVKNK